MPKTLMMNGRDENGFPVDIKMAVEQLDDGSFAQVFSGELLDPLTQVPKVIETRMISMRTANAGDMALGGSATPVTADGSQLVEWDGFTNSPKYAAFVSRYMVTDVENQVQFWMVVFNKTAAQAAVAMNAAVGSTGISIARTVPAHGNADHSDVRLVPVDTGGQSYIIPLDVTITSVHVIPVTGSTTTPTESGAMMEMSVFA